MRTTNAIFFLVFFINGSLWAQRNVKLHLVSFADETDVYIGKGCSNDLLHMKDFFINTVGKYTDIVVIDYNPSNIFDTKKLVDIAKEIEVSSDDVIVFFYSGHGYRYSDQENEEKLYPYLTFKLDEKDRLNFNLEGIHKAFINANPRLTITIGDLCNSIDEFLGDEQDDSSYLSSINDEILDKLFLEAKGDVLVSSSKPGEVSWVIPDLDEPISIFTASFLFNMNYYLSESKESVSWEKILNRTKEYAINLSQHYHKFPQNAIHQVNVIYNQ